MIEVLERPKEHLKSYQKEEIVNSLIKEIPQRKIAHQHDTSQNTISRINRECKEIITQRKREIISQLPNIVDTIKDDVNTNKRLSKHIAIDFINVDSNLIALKNTLDKTNLNVLKIAREGEIGIFPTNTLLSQYNQFNDNRSINIEPSIMGLFSGGFNKNMEVIDMEEVSNTNDKS